MKSTSSYLCSLYSPPPLHIKSEVPYPSKVALISCDWLYSYLVWILPWEDIWNGWWNGLGVRRRLRRPGFRFALSHETYQVSRGQSTSWNQRKKIMIKHNWTEQVSHHWQPSPTLCLWPQLSSYSAQQKMHHCHALHEHQFKWMKALHMHQCVTEVMSQQVRCWWERVMCSWWQDWGRVGGTLWKTERAGMWLRVSGVHLGGNHAYWNPSPFPEYFFNVWSPQQQRMQHILPLHSSIV